MHLSTVAGVFTGHLALLHVTLRIPDIMYRALPLRRAGAGSTAIRLLFVVAASTLAAFTSAQAQRAPSKAVKAARPAAAKAPSPAPDALPPDGKKIFSTTCAACHQASGEGVEGTYPPLAGSEWVADNEAKLVRIILQGLTGPVEVAGQTFAGAMPAWGGVLKDPEIAAVATYVRSAWGNNAAAVTSATVTGIRAATKARTTPWTAPEMVQVVAPIK